MTAVGGTATAVALLVWVAHRGLGLDLDPELAALIVGALASVAGYLAKERRDQDTAGQKMTLGRHRYPPPPRRPPDDAGLTTVEILLIIIVVMLFVLVAVTTGARIDV
jgi:hypothetical protein